MPSEFVFKRSYLKEREEATEVDMAATALLSDTPIQVSEDSVELESSEIETFNGRIGKLYLSTHYFQKERCVLKL